jgi:hypothetical protein
MKNRAKWMVLAAALLLGGQVAGCAASGDGATPAEDAETTSPLRLKDGKRIAQAGELEIAELIRKEDVTAVHQREKGSLLSCAGDGLYRWAGGTDVEVSAGVNLTDIVDRVAAHYSARAGWSASRDTSPWNEPEAFLQMPNGGRFIVGGAPDRSIIEIFSFSPCFRLQGDESPHSYY